MRLNTRGLVGFHGRLTLGITHGSPVVLSLGPSNLLPGSWHKNQALRTRFYHLGSLMLARIPAKTAIPGNRPLDRKTVGQVHRIRTRMDSVESRRH